MISKIAVTIAIIVFILMIFAIVYLLVKVSDLEIEIKFLEIRLNKSENEKNTLFENTYSIMKMECDVREIQRKLGIKK